MARETVSPKQMASARWARVDPKPWGKCNARWKHEGGWRLEHCGHPTALYPWALYAPDGRMIRTGALTTPPNIDNGIAWSTIAMAVQYVAEVIAGLKTLPPPPGRA